MAKAEGKDLSGKSRGKGRSEKRKKGLEIASHIVVEIGSCGLQSWPLFIYLFFWVKNVDLTAEIKLWHEFNLNRKASRIRKPRLLSVNRLVSN